ncbi:F-box/LRR-repeat protein At4g14103-like [Papaver somniferum]|uniref:F-box/LRR-repeat protein At4g14103-like n=1 Tax=Papaver somniferum TaxID=3469 RepID=UPI000E6FF3F1|nr:F-box/LRR-repeat protein At4g14103-like [Papaver somniferum]
MTEKTFDQQNRRRMETRNKKKKKLFISSQSRNIINNNTEDVAEDIISKLPEPLIHHIFSFLPTKCAVSTTVLSKRWKNLWISIACGDLKQHQKTNRFMDFLDNTLISSNISSTMQRFCLSCDNESFDANRVREWIVALINRKIEELILTVNCTRPNLVPLDLFSCESLTMLDFDFGKEHVLDFSQSISLPKLKVLRLSCILFKDKELTQQFLSNCPTLEELVLCRCRQEDLDVLSFSALRLKLFALKGSLRERFCYNLRLEIDAPNLVSIEYGGWLPRDFLAGNFPSLVEADLCHARDNEIITLNSLSKFVRLCSNIKHLKASYKCFQIFGIANVPLTSFPTFNNLVRLEVDYDYPHFPLPSMRSLVKFLHLSPNLESLVINQVPFIQELNGYELTLNTTPHCLLVCLNSLELRNCKGLPEEMEFARLFLKHAQVLQLVIFRRGTSLTSSCETMQQLQNFPRSSTRCSFQLL